MPSCLRRRASASALIVALSLGLLAGPASAVRRVNGSSRIQTAVEVSQRFFTSAETVLVARADGFADALAGASLAGQRGAPLLFVERDRVSSAVRQEIARLGADRVIVLGGPNAISDRVVRDLGPNSYRIAGEDRYETAANIALAVHRRGAVDRVFLATGLDFPDAVAVAALAAKLRAPILLTAPGDLPAATVDVLRRIEPSRVTVVGGTSVVSTGVGEQVRRLGPRVDRLSGDTRYDTSAAIVRASIDAGLRSTHRVVVSGEGYADALAAAPAAGLTDRVLALAPRYLVGPAPLAAHNGCSIVSIEVVGGANVLDEVVVERLRDAEQGNCAGDPGPGQTWHTEAVAAGLRDALNGHRRAHGLAALPRVNDLDTVARNWSDEMAASGRLGHNPNLGSQVREYRALAENVGRFVSGNGPITGADLQRAVDVLHASWLDSAPHHANMDDARWDDIGLGISVRDDKLYATVIFRQR